MKKQSMTMKKLKKQERDAQIKSLYLNMPPGLRSMRYLADIFKVSKSTVHYAIVGRNNKK